MSGLRLLYKALLKAGPKIEQMPAWCLSMCVYRFFEAEVYRFESVRGNFAGKSHAISEYRVKLGRAR